MTTRRPLLSVVLAGLLVGLAATAHAAEAAGPTVVIGASDDPDVRASLTFPTGWRLEAADDDTRRSINAVAVDERCELDTRRSDFADPRTDVDDFVVGLAPGSGFELIERTTVELPSITAERVDFASEDGGQWSVYEVPDAGYMHELWCRGDELPDDRWLPIAETFDIDPPADLASSPFDPVVARPDAGVAMAFGEEWSVRGSSTTLGLLYATSGSTVCSLSDYSSLAEENGWTSVDDMHDTFVENADARDGMSVDESTYLELAAGRVGFADISFDDVTGAVRYSFGNESGALMGLFCVAEPVPEDRYLELAESLTWIQPDEG